jgi:ankyrin repeat protein
MYNTTNTKTLAKHLNDFYNVDNNLSAITKLLQEGADPNTMGEWGNGLFFASIHGNFEMWNLFVKYKTNPMARDSLGDTVLHSYVKSQKPHASGEEFFLLMLKYCKSILESLDSEGKTALLSISSHSGEPFKTRILIENGANPNVKDKNGITPLLEALNSNRSSNTVRLLLDHGADVNAVSKDGTTPLLIAMLMWRMVYCYILLEHGANVNAKIGKKQISLLQIALNSKQDALRLCFYDWMSDQHGMATASTLSDVPHMNDILQDD